MQPALRTRLAPSASARCCPTPHPAPRAPGRCVAALLRTLLPCAAILCPLLAHAQPAPTPPLPATPQPAPHPAPHPALDASAAPSQWIEAVQASYRAAPVAEQIIFDAPNPTDPIRSRVSLRLDAGASSATHTEPRPPRLRIDAGRAILFAQGDRLIICHAANPSTYVEFSTPGGLGGGLLRSLPQTPLPQIALALTDEPLAWDIRNATWTQQPLLDATTVTLTGELAAGSIRVRINRQSLRLTEFIWQAPQPTQSGPTPTSAAPHAADPDVIHARIEPELDNLDPDSWPIDTTGRTKLTSPGQLKPLPPTIDIGQAVPTLGLMTDDLAGWSLLDNLKALAAKPPPAASGTGPRVAAALVLMPPDADTRTVRTAHDALRAAEQLAREYDIQRLQNLPNAPRLLTALVGVLELDQISRDRIRQLRSSWNTDAHSTLLWTGAGLATLHQMAPAQRSALILIDQQQRLLAVIPLEGRMLDVTTIRTELREAMNQQ